MNSIGEQFKKTREKQGITLSEAAARTQIKVQQLQDLENNDYAKIPAPVYAKGFIKLYAQHLGLDPKELITQYEHDFLNVPTEEELELMESETAAPEPKFAKKWLRKEDSPASDEDKTSGEKEPASEETETTSAAASLKELPAIKLKPVAIGLAVLLFAILLFRLFQGENVLEKRDLLKSTDVLIEHPAEPYLTMD